MSRYKPYPEYKDSSVEWLPKLPVNWKILRLGAIFQERGERGGEKSELLAVSQQYGVLPQAYLMEITERRLSASSSDDWSNYRRVCKGDIVYNKMRLWQGAIGLSAHDGIVSPAYVVLNPLTEVSGRFYEYLFKTSLFITEAGRYSQGLCDDMNSCRYEDFKSARIILPTLNEQHMIVTYLDREIAPINDLINAKTRFIELLREKRQTLITHAVTKGLDPNVKMKDSGVEWLGQVPEHWQVRKLVQLTTKIGDGLHGTPQYVESSDYFFINGNNLANGFIVISEGTKCISYEELIQNQVDLNEQTLLMSINGTIGNVAFYRGEPVMLGKSAAYINCSQMLSRELLFFLLQSTFIKTFFDLEITGTTILNLSLQTIRNTPIPLPPIGEQVQIGAYLGLKTARIDALITKTERSIELLKERRSALITAAVTGQIDLREVKE